MTLATKNDVTAAAKAATDVDDAAVAVAEFCTAWPEPQRLNAVTTESPLSPIGAAALWAGWGDDLQLLRTPCLVLKAAPTL